MARSFGKTTVANVALGLLGAGKQLTDLDNQKTSEADTLRLFYPLALNSALLRFQWSFAVDYTKGAMTIAEQNPSSGYRYAYKTPPDYVIARQIALKGQFVHNRDQYPEEFIPYKEVTLNGLPQIHTDLPNAAMEYTTNLGGEDAAYPESFVLLFAAVLAHMSGSSIITNNFAQIQTKLEINIKDLEMTAMAEDVLRESPKIRPVSPFITTRLEELVSYY